MSSDLPSSKPRLVRWVVLSLIALALAGVIWSRATSGSRGALYRTAKVERGTLRITVGATGVLQPEDVIDIGAQVAGKIREFGIGADGRPLDFGSTVEEGMVLAKIDESLFAGDVALQNAQVKRAVAEVASAEARLRQAERDWARAQKIGTSSGVISPSSYDSYLAAFEAAKAGVELARAGVEQAQASLKKAEQNLDYCTIRSPVRGVIVDRKVNIGQTVVASLNAPSLFLIAKDLTEMKLLVAVNEADIGSIHAGQKVSFGVDAFPDRRFTGEVRKVRLNAAMTQNVVTYTVEVAVDNPEKLLLPYLTANVEFEVAVRENALLVPNQALRFRPSGRDDEGDKRSRGENRKQQQPTVWILANGEPKAVPVKVLGTDGSRSEVEGEGLAEGVEVIVAAEEAAEGGRGSGGRSPFAPQLRSGRRS